MSGSDLVVGLDIGTTKILTLVGEARGDSVRVLGVGIAPSTGLHKGVIVDIPETVASIRESVLSAQKSADARLGSAMVSLSGEHLASLNSRGGIPIPSGTEIGEEEARRVRRAARQIIHPPERVILHNIPRQYIVDGQEGVRHPIGLSAKYLEVETHIVTVGSSFLENLTKCVQRAGIDVEEVIATPLASGLAVATEAERTLGVVTIDLGGGATHIAVFKEGMVTHSAALPVGGSHLTYDLSVGLRVDRDAAEELKKEDGCLVAADVRDEEFVRIKRIGEEEETEVPRQLVAHILGPRVAELAGLVREQLAVLAESGVLPVSAVLTGGGSLLNGIAPAFGTGLALPARVGLPRNIEGPDSVTESPAASTAVGLLHFGAIRRGTDSPDPGSHGGLLHLLKGWFGSRRG